jgi:dienelactone hydrolase
MPQDSAGSETQFDGSFGTVEAYISRPDGEGPFPGLMVSHEAFGLNDDIRRIADRFASNGYLAMAPDLMGGGFGCLVKVLRDLARGSGASFDKAKASIDTLAGPPDVDDDRLASSDSVWEMISLSHSASTPGSR